jgi:folylpolyglutamate synthase
MNQSSIPEMLDWTRKAGYVPSDFVKGGLRCIHVAGTKGKGSVCAMAESILLQYREPDDVLRHNRKCLGKIGTYTSPHLMTVRERIRIDGSPISEALFTRYFFEIWDRLSAATPGSDPESLHTKPGYFRYLTILALHTFLQEGIETAIVECGIGGEYDSTNILPPEAVTVSAIARLGIDHVGMLGKTIDAIAWHKAGIMKAGVPVFTLQQVPAAQATLEKRAAEKGVRLETVKALKSAGGHGAQGIRLGMEGDTQLENASLALSVAASHLRTVGITDDVPTVDALLPSPENIPARFKRGLESAKLPGRFEVRKNGNIEWFIDGAHTIDSIEAVGKWFAKRFGEACQKDNPPTAAVLIFNQQDRDTEELIRKLLATLSKSMGSANSVTASDAEPTIVGGRKGWIPTPSGFFTHAAFCTNIPFKDEAEEATDLERQERMAELYSRVDGNQQHKCYRSVEEAVELVSTVSEAGGRVLVLVTGSLHLAGGLLKVLEKQATGKVVI